MSPVIVAAGLPSTRVMVVCLVTGTMLATESSRTPRAICTAPSASALVRSLADTTSRTPSAPWPRSAVVMVRLDDRLARLLEICCAVSPAAAAFAGSTLTSSVGSAAARSLRTLAVLGTAAIAARTCSAAPGRPLAAASLSAETVIEMPDEPKPPPEAETETLSLLGMSRAIRPRSSVATAFLSGPLFASSTVMVAVLAPLPEVILLMALKSLEAPLITVW